ncbi:WD40/YVTN/BNR-like repeat-containing protein [Devosia sp. Naph2]|uniref:WD40/YVTN/BNR-like repeat-containing protein n=1 Tax=Devosia polycyclovorans TaxID=3345148 RepID=UPI0035D098BC
MRNRQNSALTRRRFLLTTCATLGLLAFPGALQAAEPGLHGYTALAFDGDAIIAAGSDLIRSNNGGDSWETLATPGPVHALASHPGRTGKLFAGLEDGRIAISEDGGASWQDRSQGLPGAPIRAIAVAAAQPDLVYVAIEGDGLWKSEDAGQSWSLAMDRPWLADAEQDLLTLASVDLATGMGGIWIYAGTPVGLTRVPDCFCRWQDVQSGDAMDALVSGDAPPSEAPLPAGEPVLALASALSNSETLYAALPSGVWRSLNGGVAWSLALAGSASEVAVHPADPQFLIAIVDGNLKLSRDGGDSWTALAAA